MKDSKYSGIYLIVNIVDCRVYVGQTTNFHKRTHSEDLFNGSDNFALQTDYDKDESNTEFIYWITAIGIKDKNELNLYEQLFMDTLKKHGFELYNGTRSCKKEKIKLLDPEGKIAESVEESLNEDFIKRFDCSVSDLVGKSKEERKAIFEKYVKRRIEERYKKEQKEQFENLFFSIPRIKEIIGETIKLCEFQKDAVFFSKAGSYVGDGIDQILAYMKKAIKTYKYCLWTVGSRHFHKDTILKICREREKEKKDTYVIFNFTPSAQYANKESVPFRNLLYKENKDLTEEDKGFLNMEDNKNIGLVVPEDMDCTASGQSKSVLAFVIEEIFFLEEKLDFEDYKSYYVRVGKNQEIQSTKSYHLRTTSFFRLKENVSEDMLNIKLKDSSSRTFQFVAKLASPYVVRLNREIK